MRRLASAALAALLLVLAACDTDPATDVTYDQATLHAQTKCSGGAYDASVQFELRKGAGTFAPVGPVHAFHCDDEPGVEKDVPPLALSGLDHDSHYDYRLRTPQDGHWYDAAGTQDGTAYDGFDTATFPTVSVRSALSFRDSEGVNTKLAYYPSPASSLAKVKEALQSTGLRRIRDGLNWYPNGNGGYSNLRDAAAALGPLGVRAMPVMRCDEALLPGSLDAAKRDGIAPFIGSWEGPNEVNLGGPCVNNWRTSVPAFMHRLHDELATRGLDDRPIIGPSCGMFDCEAELGDLSAWVDAGNGHPYRGTGIPETAVQDKCDEYTDYLPSGGLCYFTEFGWNLPGGAQGDERIQAAYTIRAFLDYYSKGVPVSYVHQMADLDSTDDDFGLYRWDWTPRLVATAIGRMNAALGDGVPSLDQLAYRDVPPPGLRKLVFRNSSGDYVIAFWRQIEAIPNTPRSNSAGLSVTLPDAASVELYRPLDGPAPVSVTKTSSDTYWLGVSADPELLVVHPE